jgi:hypothetical protein
LRRRFALAALLLAISFAARIARGRLAGFENPTMAVWPGQVIFGFYFGILVLALQAFRILLLPAHRGGSARRLLLFVLIGLCLDLVLVNVSEVVNHVDASYGLVALWDAATFFAWMRVVELCRAGSDTQFRASALIAVAPLFALGREILFIPYATGSWRAYLDLAFGNLLVSAWIFIPRWQANQHGEHKVASLLVFMGCVYWTLNAIENVAFLAWSPLGPLFYRAFSVFGVPVYLLSVLYAVLSSGIVFVVWRWNLFRIGTQFGIARHSQGT